MEEFIGVLNRVEQAQEFITNNDLLNRLNKIYDFLNPIFENSELMARFISFMEIMSKNPCSFKQVLTKEETEHYLGVTERQLRRLMYEYNLPVFKVSNKSLYFTQVQIVEWLNQYRILTPAELEKEAESQYRKLAEKRKKI